jgi:hypothetical protein
MFEAFSPRHLKIILPTKALLTNFFNLRGFSKRPARDHIQEGSPSIGGKLEKATKNCGKRQKSQEVGIQLP